MSSQRKQGSDTIFWDKRRGTICTRKGGWIIGEAIYNQGYSMLEGLVGKASFFQVLTLNATGRFPEKALAKWLEALFICVSWPDHRIWCNQVGSLSATMQTSPVAAVCSGVLSSDSKMYGPGCMRAACEFIGAAYDKRRGGISAEEIVAMYPKRGSDDVPLIVGYARPVATGDERIAALEQVSGNLGLKTGGHISVAREIDMVMQDRYKESINLAGFCAAFLADYDFAPNDVYRLLSCAVNSGVHACYAEVADQTPGSFFPLHCEDIDYQGKPARPVPA